MISLCVSDMPHIIGKILTKATTLLQPSFQLDAKNNYGPPKLQKPQFREFWDSNLGILRQNNIWVLALWLGINNTIRGKVVASFKSEPW
jgi:hypothetical protein